MKIEEHYGLRVVEVDASQAVGTDWRALRGAADVIRVPGPAPQHWEELRAAGFLARPERVSWMAPAPPDTQTWLHRLPPKSRADVRRARRMAEGCVFEVRPLTSGLLDGFLDLYLAQVYGMRHGVPVALQAKARMQATPERFYAVTAVQHGVLHGACVLERRPERDAVWVRFSAVRQAARSSSLSRALYAEAVGSVGRTGFRTVVLGTDPSMYGHIAKAGLLSFKARLGFVPVPEGPGVCADLLLDTARLDDPVVVLAHQESPSRPLRPVIYTTTTDLDTRPYTLPGVETIAAEIGVPNRPAAG